MSKKCIKSIQNAAKKGDISPDQAEGLIDTIMKQAKQLERTKSMRFEDAVKAIAGELKASQVRMEKINRRNLLLSYKRSVEALNYLLDDGADAAGKKKPTSYKRKLQEMLAKAYGAGNSLGKRFQARLHAELNKEGVFKDFTSGVHDKDIWQEIFAIDFKKSAATKNKKAQKIARIWRDIISRDVAPMKNRHGAYIEQAPGWVIPQSHDGSVIRALAGAGESLRVIQKDGKIKIEGSGKVDWDGFAKKNSAENVARSFENWKRILRDAGIEIDEGRTFDGRDPEKTLEYIHKNLYNSRFGPTTDGIHPETFHAHGALANKLSSERVLWFKDAESAWKYNQLFGTRKSLFEAANAHLEGSGKHIAIMQLLGPNPSNNLKHIQDHMVEIISDPVGKAMARVTDDPKLRDKYARNVGRRDSARAIDQVRSSAVDGAYSVLSGEANISTRPMLSRIVDNIKAMQTLAKLGGAVISSISDKAYFQSAMVRHGMDKMDRFVGQMLVHAPKGKARTQYLEEMGYTTEVLSHTIIGRYLNDFAPWRLLKQASDFQFKLTGMNAWVRIHEQAAAEIMGFKLGREAGMTWNNLPDVRKRYLTLQGIDGDEWDEIRRRTVKGYDNKDVIAMESVRNLSDDQLDNILRKRGQKETGANRDRLRDDIESKLGAYFEDFVTEAVPKPGLRERAFTTGGKRRGEFSRELNELFFIFKSFPIAVFMKMQNAFRMSDGGVSGKLWLGHMMFQTILAGYVSMTMKDALAGKTPRKMNDIGVWIEAALRGGGAGIWGDVFFNEYARGSRTPLSTTAGPALGDLSSLVMLGSRIGREAVGASEATETKGYQAFKLLESNLPFANAWYLRPLLDNLLWLNAKESLSPGLLRRMEKSLERRDVQEYWLEPSEIGSIPVTQPGRKIMAGVDALSETIGLEE